MNSPILKALLIGIVAGVVVWAVTHRGPSKAEVTKLRGALKSAQQENDSLREQLKQKDQLLEVKSATITLLRSSHNRPN